MARKKRSVRSLMGEGVVSDGAKKFKIYNKPLMICTTIQIRSQCNPFILPRCLSYRIQAKKQKKSNSSGGAIFNYMDSKNNILKAEDVKDYSCTFCSMKCGSLEGLKLHLTSSHDIFEYNFRLWNKDHPTIDVSLKPVAFKFGELRKSLENHHGIPFTFWSKRQRRQRDDRRHLLKLERKIEDIKFTQLEPLPRKRKRTSLKESKDTSTDNQLEIGQCSKPKEPLPCRRKRTHAKRSNGISTDNQLEIGQCSEPEQPLPCKIKRTPAKRSKGTSTDNQLEIGQCSKSKEPLPCRRKRTSAKQSKDTSTDNQLEIGQCSKPKEPLPRKRKRTSLKRFKGTSTDNQLEIGQCSKSKEPLPCKRKRTSAKQSKGTSTDNQLEIGQCSKPKEPLPCRRKRTHAKRSNGISIDNQLEIGQCSEPEEPLPCKIKRTPAKRSKGTSTDNQLEIGQCSKPKEPLPCRRKRTPAKRSNGISTDRLKKLHFHNFMTGQPMTIELALAGEDSEAKPADEFKDMEERWTPDTYTDTKDEDKRIMVLADRDVPGACEAFVNNHEKELISTSQYFVQWRVFMLNLWNKGLICAKTMDKCNAFLLKSQEAAEAEAEAAVPSSSTSQATAADRNEQQPMELDHSSEKAAAASLLLLSSAVPSQATADRNGKQPMEVEE
ncbi:unnamed protein product [Thlaspi arvense]|uniref:C2H2-type domain-containing protein n=1 Tax=Thlaspi arvense TaxID=13288 RepID=A0AAU9S9Y4_THLAR|nr:unnamed protein product [Thlaspi arvense]